MPHENIPHRGAFDGIRSWVHQNLGIVFPEEKLDSFQRRLDEVVKATGIPTYEALYDQLKEPDASSLQLQISQAMTTNHTGFFREADTLNALFQDPPPRSEEGPMRVWSAACSTGQEPYSLSILAHEIYGARCRQEIAILATDISSRAINKATSGIYGSNAMSSVSTDRQRLFFTESADGYEISASIKDLCTFRRLNLTVGSWPFKRQFHAVYCRNVLYYFDRDQQVRIVQRIHRHVVPGGWLFTSVTETLRDLDTSWAYLQPGIYRKEA